MDDLWTLQDSLEVCQGKRGLCQTPVMVMSFVRSVAIELCASEMSISPSITVVTTFFGLRGGHEGEEVSVPVTFWVK